MPGAFCRLSMFDAVDPWVRRGYALARYRFPGLDGRARTPPLKISAAAAEIAAFAARYPEKPVLLLGYSTGFAIAVTAAALMGRPVRIAGLSPAVERGGGGETALRTSRLLAVAALQARSLHPRTVWLSYYKALLFGAGVWADAALSERASGVLSARRDEIVFPDAGLLKAHTRDLRRWSLPDTLRVSAGQVRLFAGEDDPVFSQDQTAGLAARLGPAPVRVYPGHGHLLFATCPEAFDDIFAFFEER